MSWVHAATGYRYCYAPDGRVRPEHRVIMEVHLGRTLERGEHIHHLNGVKTDNRLENLEVISAEEHTRRHHTPERMVACHKKIGAAGHLEKALARALFDLGATRLAIASFLDRPYNRIWKWTA